MKPLFWLLPLLLLAPLGLLLGQEKGSGRRGASEPPMAVTPEREEAVNAFVAEHHAELKEVLASLKAMGSSEYDKAIREIYRESQRLDNLKQRDPDQFKLEVQLWTIRSRIQLLTARMAMGPSDEIRQQLKTLLHEQVDVRAELLRRERERLKGRLTKLEGELEKLEGNRDEFVERQLQFLTNSAEASKSKARGKGVGAKRPGGKGAKNSTVVEPSRKKSNEPTKSP